MDPVERKRNLKSYSNSFKIKIYTKLTFQRLTSDFSMYKMAHSLREQRIAMIQTLGQYQLFGKAIVYLFENYLKELNESIKKDNFKSKMIAVKQIQLNSYDTSNYLSICTYQIHFRMKS